MNQLWNCICRTLALSTSLGPSRNLQPEEWAEGSEQAPQSLFSFVKSNTFATNLFECTSALPDGKDAMNYSNASRPEVARTWICKEQCLTYQPARPGKVPGTHLNVKCTWHTNMEIETPKSWSDFGLQKNDKMCQVKDIESPSSPGSCRFSDTCGHPRAHSEHTQSACRAQVERHHVKICKKDVTKCKVHIFM